MYNKFIRAVSWNSLNLFAYKSILLLHQITLFRFIPKELYGLAGTLFATIYFLIGVTGFGFEYNLFSIFSSRSTLQNLQRQLSFQFISKLYSVLLAASFIVALFYCDLDSNIIAFFTRHIPYPLFFALILIFISESLKKYLDTTAQLLFLNKQITVIQLSALLLYVSMVWGSYILYKQILLRTIFIPMAVVSCLELLMLSLLILRNINNSKTIKPSDQSKSSYNQGYNFVNQFTKSIFSPNFLMIFISYNLGMSQTGEIRFFTNIITLLYMFLNRAIGLPSAALLSKLTHQSFQKVKDAFLHITNAYIQLLYFFGITIVVTMTPYLINDPIAMHVALFTAVGFIEYITLTYEKLFIIESNTKTLAIINSLCLFLFIASCIFQQFFTLLLPVFIIRLCSTFCIGIISYKKWNLFPKLSVNLSTLIISILASFLFFFIHIK